jgi:hypothetical protein
MTLEHLIMLALFALGIGVLAYLGHTEQKRMLGQALLDECGGDVEIAYEEIARIRNERDIFNGAMTRGQRALTDAELDELLAPPEPIRHTDFVVTPRGYATYQPEDAA